MRLLDATYKTMCYALLLFFMVGKRNVDFQIVESFVIENKTYKAISEAVAAIKSWNPKFHEEVRALKSNFSSTV